MNEKTLRSIVTALAVLVVLWGATLGMGMAGGGSSFSAGVERVLEGLDPSTVTGFIIRSPTGESTTVTQATDASQVADAWEANGYPADRDAILRVWGALAELEVGGVVAMNPINHTRMGVSDTTAWTVVFQTTSGDRTVLVGKAGRSFATAYARLPEEDEVVLTSGDLRASLARPEADWRDKTIVVVDTTLIARIIVERDDGDRTTIQRDPDGWTVEGEAARPSAISAFMAEVARMTASGFKADSAESFENNERLLRVEDSRGEVLAQLRFLGNGTTQQAMVVGGSGSGGVTFEIPNWRVERLTPTRTMLKELPSGR